MLNKVILEGKTIEEILEKFLKDNNLSNEDIYYKEIKKESGLFKGRKISLEIITKNDIIDYLKNYLNDLSNYMNIDIKSEIREKDGVYSIMLVSEQNSIVIGKDGKTIDAIQLLLKQSISNQTGFNIKIVVDAGNYRSGKQRRFESEIKRVAREVQKTKVSAKLDPMNSFNRRIVHTILTDFENIETESFGETPERYVIIKYKD